MFAAIERWYCIIRLCAAAAQEKFMRVLWSADYYRRMHVQILWFWIGIENSCMWIMHVGTCIEHGLPYQVCDLQCVCAGGEQNNIACPGRHPGGNIVFVVYVQSPWALI